MEELPNEETQEILDYFATQGGGLISTYKDKFKFDYFKIIHHLNFLANHEIIERRENGKSAYMLPKFYQVQRSGGIKRFIEQEKEKRQKQLERETKEEMLIDLSITTNENARITNINIIIVSVMTLIIAAFTAWIQWEDSAIKKKILEDSKNSNEQLLEEKNQILHKKDTITKIEKEEK